MSQKVDAYSIFDIAKWQIELEEKIEKSDFNSDNQIQLPTLQRGFVWKPHQMEALWDSILRGYPIGSLLVSESDKGIKYLLDGQQRCTTIALGFHNPLDFSSSNLMNIKKENIPSVWIDIKPLEKNKYGLRFAVRILTRSHPWGYSLVDHQKRLIMKDQRKALDYLRERCGNNALNFSAIESKYRTPWDAYYPVPLSFILKTNKKDLKTKIHSELNNITTKYGARDYNQIEDVWIEELYEGVKYAESLLLPEILIKKKSLEADDNIKEEQNEQDATLFLRLNSSGTTISGHELIYSLLKASFPKAKELVEDIGLNYLSPSRLVNIFARFLKMKRNSFNQFERPISLENFRKLLKEDGFKEELETFINTKEAKTLMDAAVGIVKDHPSKLPAILVKEMIALNIDLVLVLLVFLYKRNNELTDNEKKELRRSFLHSTLFSKSKEKQKFIPKFYAILKNNNFKWAASWDECSHENPLLLPPLLQPNDFSKILDKIRSEYFKRNTNHFASEELLRGLFLKEEKLINLAPIASILGESFEERITEKQVDQFVMYWIRLSNYVFRNKQFLILVQRKYFNEQFDDYMVFDVIEDTNRPWDWDHIYPNSWIYRKDHISKLVRWLKDTNGNYRALSFNENRSESNNYSPKERFLENVQTQKNSFICSNDLQFWLELTSSDKRLKDGDQKIEYFVNAVFSRVSNIYIDAYSVIHELEEKKD